MKRGHNNIFGTREYDVHELAFNVKARVVVVVHGLLCFFFLLCTGQQNFLIMRLFSGLSFKIGGLKAPCYHVGLCVTWCDFLMDFVKYSVGLYFVFVWFGFGFGRFRVIFQLTVMKVWDSFEVLLTSCSLNQSNILYIWYSFWTNSKSYIFWTIKMLKLSLY